RAGRRAQGALPCRDARGGLLRRDRARVRAGGRGRGKRRVRVRGAAATLRHELIGVAAVLQRNAYLVKRYVCWELAFFVWSLANTLTIVFIAKGIHAAGGKLDVDRATTTLLIGAVIWSYLGVVFEILTETVAWERWEGTIEYTFMAPLARPIHLIGMGLFAVVYGVLRTAVLFAVIAAFFSLSLGGANFAAALVVLAVASVSFIGIGMMTAVLPLISPEKGMQMGFIAQGLLLVISGVYYSVSVLPEWMQWLSTISPATYALRGIRHAILDGYSVGAVWGDIWPLVVIGFVAIPARSEERRVGKECRSRGSRGQYREKV